MTIAVYRRGRRRRQGQPTIIVLKGFVASVPQAYHVLILYLFVFYLYFP